MLRGEDSMAYTALRSVVSWMKAVDVGEHLEEFHLCPRFMFDGNEADIDQKPMIEQTIMPSLLELQAYLTQDRYGTPPKVKLSVNCSSEEGLEVIRAGLPRLAKAGLEVNSVGELRFASSASTGTYSCVLGQSLCGSKILGTRTPCLQPLDLH
jgi:hypothetical protein